MDTPICDFVRAYAEKGGTRLHMPGHKGIGPLGAERLDITEIRGADELYRAKGIIRQSEENAAVLFGAARTVYSAEGSSLCVRAMTYLALLDAKRAGRSPVILAGRNAHRSFLSAAALLDAEIRWVFPETDQSFVSCPITPARLEEELAGLSRPPAAVYVTSPDYLGHMLDLGGLAEVCHAHQTLLLTDNAHGAYLKFLRQDRHPMTLGADLCCDSAHKTLPVLTGGAYLHVGKNAPKRMGEEAEEAMALFASTSPSYLILQSLDQCSKALTEGYADGLKKMERIAAEMKAALKAHGYALEGDEPGKITLAPKAFGYTGNALHDLLREKDLECEFSDPDYVTLMLSPSLTEEDLERAMEALLGIPRKAPVLTSPPPLPRPERALTPRQAMLRPFREVQAQDALGKILYQAQMGCPPCVPILMSGERIDEKALACFGYYGIEQCRVIAD